MILIGIDTAGAQHIWVHHAAAEDLEPIVARANLDAVPVARTADIHLGRGFGEREVAWSESDRHVVHFEIGAAELNQAAFEVSHMRRLIDHEAFDLVEHRRVSEVRIAAIGPPRRDDPDRGLFVLHGADLHRRGMRAQHHARRVAFLGQIEGVVHLPGRMLGRDVEGLEIVEVVLNVRAFGDRKAHLPKDSDHFVQSLANRV